MPCASLAASRCASGIIARRLAALRERLQQALESADIVLLSGGTSKGAGDVSYRVVAELDDPGIVAHGVALKPGKPICLAATGGRAGRRAAGLSDVGDLHVSRIRRAGDSRRWPAVASQERTMVPARLAVKVNSEIGRTEYLLVGLVETADDGRRACRSPRIRWDRDPAASRRSAAPTVSRRSAGTRRSSRRERIDRRAAARRDLQLADLVVIGSHCIGLDYLLGELQQRGVRSKFLAVGSTAGLDAAKRGECDVAGIHLLDPKTDEYNRPFLTPSAGAGSRLRPRAGRRLSAGRRTLRRHARRKRRSPRRRRDPSCVMVNRNQGSGTRALIDRLLDGVKPRGLCRAAAQSQCGRRRRRAGPGGLGTDARHDCAQCRPRISAGAGRAIRLRRAEVARESRRRGRPSRAAAAKPSTRGCARAPRDESLDDE